MELSTEISQPRISADKITAGSESFQVILRSVGENGRYQWRIFGIASFCGIFFAFSNLGAAFLAATPKYWCVPSDGIRNFSNVETNRIFQKSFLIENSTKLLSSCSYYEVEKEKNLSQEFKIMSNTNDSMSIEKDCKEWLYDDSIYKTTVVTEWDLVCDEQWMSTLAQSTYMLGFLFGSIIFSELSDMYGRRTVAVFSAIGFVIFGVSVTFSVNFMMFLILRFVSACFGSGLYLPNFVLVMEMVGSNTRGLMGMLYQLSFAIGFMILPGIAYFIRDWRYLQLAISLPSTLLLSYYWLLPESPRWLLVQGRQEEASKILRKMAEVNGSTLPEDKELKRLYSNMHVVTEPTDFLQKVKAFFTNQATLLRTPVMRKRCLIIFFCWFVVAMVYYGLTFSGENINASIYLMVFLSGIVELPSYAVACFTLERFGRKLNLSCCFLVCGVACMLILAVPKDMIWINIIFASIGKFFNSVGFALVYVYSAELVPTKVRNIAVGTSNVCARAGSALAPFIVDSLGRIHYAIPSTVFGILSIMAGILALQLPETGKMKLPESVEEVEAMDR